MNTRKPDLVIVGALAGAHGVRGDVRVKSFTAEPDALFDYAPFVSEAGEPLLDPKSARAAKDHFIVTPKQPRQKEDWDTLRGASLCVPRDRLPPVEEDEYYIDDLVGLDVFSGGEAAIGTIRAVHDHGAGDLLEIDRKDGGKSVLVPFTRVDVPVVDLDAGRIVVATFDVWADESKPALED